MCEGGAVERNKMKTLPNKYRFTHLGSVLGITPEEFEANKELIRSAPSLLAENKRLREALVDLMPISEASNGIADAYAKEFEAAEAALEAKG